MHDITENELKKEISFALRTSKVFRITKLAIAILLCVAYFAGFKWFNAVLFVAVMFCLILPMDFFDIYILKLLETQKYEKK